MLLGITKPDQLKPDTQTTKNTVILSQKVTCITSLEGWGWGSYYTRTHIDICEHALSINKQ